MRKRAEYPLLLLLCPFSHPMSRLLNPVREGNVLLAWSRRDEREDSLSHSRLRHPSDGCVCAVHVCVSCSLRTCILTPVPSQLPDLLSSRVPILIIGSSLSVAVSCELDSGILSPDSESRCHKLLSVSPSERKELSPHSLIQSLAVSKNACIISSFKEKRLAFEKMKISTLSA